MKSCKHFWVRMGLRGAGMGWPDGHALAKCRHCGVWTVIEYGKMGPCEHVVAADAGPLHEVYDATELYVAYELALKRAQGDDSDPED